MFKFLRRIICQDVSAYSLGSWWIPTTSSQGRSTDELAGEKVSEQEFRRPQHNDLTSINAEIDRRDTGSVPIAQRISNI